MLTRRTAAFTIVELLVIIGVIGVLSTVGLVAYNGVQARARDTTRMSDLDRVADALAVYESENATYLEAGSGCGANGNGQGWLTYEGGAYVKSITNCLKDAGYLPDTVKDPSGGNGTSTPASGYAYMKYHCGSGASKRAFVYAKLERTPQSATATDGTCSDTLDTSYGMNYYVQVK
jgi:type II secretory pathway pseudopilin PulG